MISELLFWTIIGVVVTIEVFGGVVCCLHLKEVDQCHK